MRPRDPSSDHGVQTTDTPFVMLKPEPHGRPDIVWVTLEQGRMQTFEHEPGASAHRKVEAMFLKLLPIDGLL